MMGSCIENLIGEPLNTCPKAFVFSVKCLNDANLDKKPY